MNLNYLFNNEYYKKLRLVTLEKDKGSKSSEASNGNDRHMADCNKFLIRAAYDDENKASCLDGLINGSFQLKTTYPGLLVGIGNAHQSKSSSDEIRFGFTMDYVTGLPVIPGSTVKGVLASAFNEHPDYVSELAGIREASRFEQWKNRIFGSGSELEPQDGDVFFDAVIVSGGRDGRVLGLDFITPHINSGNPRLNGLTEPIPNKLLKVIPDVTFEFRFIVNENRIDGSEKTKLEVFKEIICDLGIGAKTNTGFGRMVEVRNAGGES